MISVRQSLVDVHKGDLPGHPFRGNQCVDEDWQPQPGDPCSSGERRAMGESSIRDDSRPMDFVTGERRGDMTGSWVFDRDEAERRIGEAAGISDEAQFGEWFQKDVAEKLNELMQRDDWEDVIDVAPMIKPVVIGELHPDMRVRDVEGVLRIGDNDVISQQAGQYNLTFGSLAEASANAWNPETKQYDVFDGQLSDEERVYNDGMWGMVRPLGHEVTLYRGTNFEEAELSSGGAPDSGREHLDFDLHHQGVGNVREPTYFMPTSLSSRHASKFAEGNMDVGWFMEGAEDAMNDGRYGRAGMMIQIAAMVSDHMASSMPVVEDVNLGYMSVINVPADAQVIPVDAYNEEEVILAPGYQLVQRDVIEYPVIDGVLFSAAHVYDYVPSDEQHYTDSRGRT